MVRTQSPPFVLRFDTSRILALSTAIALHVLAAALLLIPLSRHPVAESPPPKQRWQIPELTPPAPTPPPLVPTQTRTAPPPRPIAAAPIDQPVLQPLPTTAMAAPDPLASVAPETPTPTLAPATTAASSPATGVQLQYASAPAPAYPRAALQARLQGTVVLRVLVDVDGQPLEVTVESSSGHRVLDQAARSQVLRHWRFRPALVNGQASQAYGLVPVAFSLQ